MQFLNGLYENNGNGIIPITVGAASCVRDWQRGGTIFSQGSNGATLDTIASAISGSGQLTAYGFANYNSTNLTLTGNNRGFSGGLSLPNGGVLELDGAASSGTGPIDIPINFRPVPSTFAATPATFLTSGIVLGGWDTLNLSLDNVSSGTGNTIGLSTFTADGLAVLNVTGSHGYNLSIGTLTSSGDTLNPTTANVAIGTITGSLNNPLTLGGTATGNTIGQISMYGNGGLNVTGMWTLTGPGNYSGPTTISGGTLQVGNGGSGRTSVAPMN